MNIKKLKKKLQEIIKEIDNPTLLKLDNPTSHKVVIDCKNSPEDVPCAWEYKGKWYYNWRWAIEEASYRGLRLPEIDELMNCEDELLNETNGLRYTNGSYRSLGSIGNRWTSTQNYSTLSRHRNWNSSDSVVSRSYNYKTYGFTVVCFKS